MHLLEETLRNLLWRKAIEWASKRPDLILADPKHGIDHSPALKASVVHEFEVEGKPYQASLSNWREYCRWGGLSEAMKEPYTNEWIKKFTVEGGVSYDVGANVGALPCCVAFCIHRC